MDGTHVLDVIAKEGDGVKVEGNVKKLEKITALRLESFKGLTTFQYFFLLQTRQ